VVLLEPLFAIHPAHTGVRAARVFGLVEAGRMDDARRGLKAFAREGFARLLDGDNWIFSLTLLGWVCFELEDAEAARTLADLLAPRANDCVDLSTGQFCSGPVGFPLGLLALIYGNLDDAERYLAVALERTERLRSPVWRAWVLAAQARRGGAPAKQCARRLAHEARAIAQELGMERVLRELESLGLD
jgi:hypothetical protein